jgi:mercuric ion transport protein
MTELSRAVAPSIARSREGAGARAGQNLIVAGGLLAGLATASCCVIPFALFLLGISGAWISNLTALEPCQPIFAAFAFGFLGYGFYLVYRRPEAACIEGSYCAEPGSKRIAKMGLWSAAILVIIALGFPKLALLFL